MQNLLITRLSAGIFLLLLAGTLTAQDNPKSYQTTPAATLLDNYLSTKSRLKTKANAIALKPSEDKLEQKTGIRTV